MMEIGQNDGGGDREEQWEFDIVRTHTRKSSLLSQGT